MLQVYDALFESAIRLGGEYGPSVALAVLVFVGCGIAWRILFRGGPKGN
jgi:hypothetical protein